MKKRKRAKEGEDRNQDQWREDLWTIPFHALTCLITFSTFSHFLTLRLSFSHSLFPHSASTFVSSPPFPHLPSSQMVTSTTKKTLIISVSAIVGLTAIYLLIRDDRRVKHQRKIGALQKQLNHKLKKIEASVQEVVESDIRLAQVRIRTLRTYPIFPGDPHVQLPSLGLINEQDKIDLGDEIQETQEELIRERTQGYGEDPHKVRQGYKRLEFLVNSVNERLLRLLESLDAISPRELTDLGDVSGGVVATDGLEMQVFEKIRKRKRKDIATIQKWMTQMDKVGAAFKDRLIAVDIYEKKAKEENEEREDREAAAAAAIITENKKGKEDEEEPRPYHVVQHTHVKGHAAESDLVKEGLSFAAVASHNIKQDEVLVQTEDLERMKGGVTFADVASHNSHHEHVDHASFTTTTTTITTTSDSSESITISDSSSSSSSSTSGETLTTEDTSHHHSDSKTTEEVLQETEDLERMKAGTTFADVAAASAELVDVNEVGEEKTSAVAEMAMAH